MSRESDWWYDGPLSTSTEWHAMAFGLVLGLILGSSDKTRRQILRELHYFVGGLLLGLIVGLLK